MGTHKWHGSWCCLLSQLAEASAAFHRINLRGWKGPLWVTQPNPLPKQGHLEQAAQHHVQAGLEYLQRRRLHNLPGQPVPALCGLQAGSEAAGVSLALPLILFQTCPQGNKTL